MSTTDTFSTQGLGGILKFDKDKGPAVSSRAKILQDLSDISKAAFGTDFVIEQGTEWYSFIDMLSYVLADFGGACVEMYNSMSVNNATGKNLDSICALNGIIRKAAQPATVIITLTLPETDLTIDSGATMFVRDSSGRSWSWTNNAEKSVEYLGKQSFELTFSCTSDDAVNAYVNAGENWTLQSALNFSYTTGIQYKNQSASILGSQQETDGALRYRYFSSNFKQASGTVEGLRAQLLNLSYVTYCVIQQDTGNHTIEVIIDGAGHSLSEDQLVGVADTIVRYKSLGCGLTYPANTADFGDFQKRVWLNSKDYHGAEDEEYQVDFMMVAPVEWTLDYGLERLHASADSVPDEVFDMIDAAIVDYVDSLSPGTSITSFKIISLMNSVLSLQNEDYQLNKLLLNNNASTNKINVPYWRYANTPQITNNKTT